MLRNELEKELIEIHAKLRNELSDILTMINLTGDDCGITIQERIFLDRPNSNFNTDEAYEDCIKIRKQYPIINDKALAVEKEFLEKMFSEYEDIQSCWLMHSYITKHILIYSAIMFRTVMHFQAFNFYFIEKFLETYPYKYEYHLESGNDLLNLYNGILKDFDKHEEIERLYFRVFTDTRYSIKRTKWYILREYHRHLLGEDSSDINYLENVLPRGILTKQEAINTMNNMGNFFPHHYQINNCFLGTMQYIEFF